MVKKSLGQHFLNAPGVIDDMLEAGEVKKGDTVLEIGPGKGVLTRALTDVGAQVIAIEKDDWLTVELQETFKNELESGQLTLRNIDFLKDELPELREGEYKVVANIPYNITGLIMRRLFEAENQPSVIVLMVQKEVAERILARDGKESVVSISVKVYGTPSIVRVVKRGSFFPPPKVDSAVLAIKNISKDMLGGCPEKDFFKGVKAGFSSKRKKLKNNLTPLTSSENIAQTLSLCGIDENIRAEDIKVEDWVCITKNLEL